MKKIALLGLFILFITNVFCQTNSDDYDYIDIHSKVSEGKFRHVSYFRIDNKYYLKIIDTNDSTPIIKELKDVNLFEKIAKNKKSVRRLGKLIILKDSLLIIKGLKSTYNRRLAQLGLSCDNIHYNHFPRFSDEDLNNKAFSKYYNGMKLINELYDDLERLSPSNYSNNAAINN